jgi:Glycosyltransferase like family
VIAFGCAISDQAIFERVALPSIRRVAEPDSLVIVRSGYDSIQEPYNLMMQEAAAHPDLEALILMHQDLELLDDSLLDRIRPLLDQPRMGIVGLFGGRAVPLHYWSDTDELYGRSRTPMVDVHHSVGSHDVDVVDGVLLVMVPWVVRTLRFSPMFARCFHGYDVDFSLRVGARGGRVICNDIPYFHHMERPWKDPQQVLEGGQLLSRMWDPRMRPSAWRPAFNPLPVQ